MVRHIVAWNFKDGFTDKENTQHAKRIKDELEGLVSIVDGVISIKVEISLLPASNRDIVLNSLFENEEALANYQKHPEHARAGEYIGTVMTNRVCVDYIE